MSLVVLRPLFDSQREIIRPTKENRHRALSAMPGHVIELFVCQTHHTPPAERYQNQDGLELVNRFDLRRVTFTHWPSLHPQYRAKTGSMHHVQRCGPASGLRHEGGPETPLFPRSRCGLILDEMAPPGRPEMGSGPGIEPRAGGALSSAHESRRGLREEPRQGAKFLRMERKLKLVRQCRWKLGSRAFSECRDCPRSGSRCGFVPARPGAVFGPNAP
ncbi:hypothetical protein SAMN04488094_110140 [Tropicimonas isoalkanivorans]|uniref:Uncharacterized protein n=1 Tax=Tropicimonas isoalkanivorans TaxID=441112 RepID=A0A1I1N0D5_9RHOB|nr:hypothetical protein SAMN04488094_110140 [Tropicimonas isoalkanivorans]